jgi:hypothetical protein
MLEMRQNKWVTQSTRRKKGSSRPRTFGRRCSRSKNPAAPRPSQTGPDIYGVDVVHKYQIAGRPIQPESKSIRRKKGRKKAPEKESPPPGRLEPPFKMQICLRAAGSDLW